MDSWAGLADHQLVTLALRGRPDAYGELVRRYQAAIYNTASRARHNAETVPIRSFLVGLINFTFFGLIAVAFMSGGQIAGLVGLATGTILLSFVAIGLSAVARLVGERLRPGDPSTLRQLLIGAITLELAALVPVVGWVMVPALAGLVGYGATIIALIRRTKRDDVDLL